MKPVIVIGNGVSLREHLIRGDFDLLADKAITIAMNHIDDLYHLTDWRPDHWMFSEQNHSVDEPVELEWILKSFVEPGISECHIAVGGYYTGSMAYNFPDADLSQVHCRNRCDDVDHGGQVGDKNTPTCWHLPVFCRYAGTMNCALQLAMELDPPTVGVIGCDLGYTGPFNNNFNEDNISSIDGEWSRHDATLADMHRIAAMEYSKAGIPIFNAGIGGSLEAYERIDLVDLLENCGKITT